MGVYVDGANIPATVGRHKSTWCHLTADTKDELHAFIATIGLRRSYFQDDVDRPGAMPGGWHYDLTAGKRKQAVAAGAVELDRDAFMDIIRKPGRAGRERWGDIDLRAERAVPAEKVAWEQHVRPQGWGTYHATLDVEDVKEPDWVRVLWRMDGHDDPPEAFTMFERHELLAVKR